MLPCPAIKSLFNRPFRPLRDRNQLSRDFCFFLLDSALLDVSILLTTVLTLSSENP